MSERATRVESASELQRNKVFYGGVWAALLFAAAFELWLLARPGSHALVSATDDSLNAAGPLLAVAAFFVWSKPWKQLSGARAGRAQALAPTVIALGALSFAAGQVIWTYDEQVLGQATPFPSWADGGYLAAHLFLLIGIILLPGRPLSFAFRTRAILDGLLLLTAVTTVSWYFVLGPNLRQAGLSPFAKAVSVSYPLSELALVFCLLLLWGRSHDIAMRRVVPTLLAALSVIVTADSIYGYQLLHGTYATGELLDPAWALGWMLVAVAALSAGSKSDPAVGGAVAREDIVPEPSRMRELWRSFLPYTVLPIILVLMAYVGDRRGDRFLERGVYVGAGVLIALVLVHQVLVILENVEANKRLRVLWRHSAEKEALRQSETQFRTLIEDMDVGVILLGAGGELLIANDAALGLLGGRQPEAVPLDLNALASRLLYCRGAGLPVGTPPIRHVLETGQPVRNAVVAMKQADEGQRWYLLNAVPHHTPHGLLERIVCTFTEITERQRVEEALRESEERFRAIFELSPIGIELADMEGRFLDTNAAAQKMLGYSADELRGMLWSEITHPDDVRMEDALDNALVAGEIGHYQIEKRHIHKDGSIVWTRQTVSEMRDAAGNPVFGIAMIEDIGERKKAEEALAYQAMHDALTDLPNRALLHDRLEQSILAAARDGTCVALLLMDLDRFKDVNDTFGHHYGDLLLREVGGRLEEVLRVSDTVARLGGDEFAVLLPSADEVGAKLAAGKILTSLAEPFVLEGQGFDIGASIGIAISPEHGSDAHALMRRADVAMYAAKRNNSGFAVYAPDQDQYSPARMALVADLRQSIEQDMLMLHYQPKVHLATGCAEHVEALVRWHHPHHGWIPPDQFIPLAEHTGLIKRLTLWVLDRALQQTADWHAYGLDISVSVNLSARNLHDPELVDVIDELLSKHGVAPEWLEVEITESTVMADPSRAMDILTDLHNRGIGIAIDDFGTRYSSLGYLKRLPVDQIKIDKSFVIDMVGDGDDAVIVRSVLDLGHNLGLQVIAEGVETGMIQSLLREMGCDLAQGYYLSRPLPADELVEWLQCNEHLAGVP